jgi:hypothetical protein
MRVYLAATLPMLRRAHAAGRYAEAGALAHAVTPALREWYTDGDTEELEYAAMLDAAEASLRLLGADDDAPRRRVVVAVEIPDRAARQAPEADADPAHVLPSTVVLGTAVTAEHVVAVHVDDEAAEADVAAAVAALPAATHGDEDARFVVDGADGHELLWFDVSEIGSLFAG